MRGTQRATADSCYEPPADLRRARCSRVRLTEGKSAAGPIEPVPTQTNASLSQPVMVPPARSRALIGLSEVTLKCGHAKNRQYHSSSSSAATPSTPFPALGGGAQQRMRCIASNSSGFYAWTARPSPRMTERNAASRARPRGLRPEPPDLWRATHSPRPPYASRRPCRLHRAALSQDRDRKKKKKKKKKKKNHPDQSGLAVPGHSARSVLPRIVGCAMHPTLTHTLVEEALTLALTARQPSPGLVFHTDGGGQYRAVNIQQLLTAHQLIASTSRPGQCLDNAVAESFFHPLKTELVTSSAIARGTRLGWPSSSTSRRFIIAPGGTPAYTINHPRVRSVLYVS